LEFKTTWTPSSALIQHPSFKDCTIDALRSIVTVLGRSVYRHIEPLVTVLGRSVYQHIDPPSKWASLSPKQQDNELEKPCIVLDPKLLLLARREGLLSLSAMAAYVDICGAADLQNSNNKCPPVAFKQSMFSHGLNGIQFTGMDWSD
jgi:hypothetical protein